MRAATPGSILPERNSSEAPPPVEMCEKPVSSLNAFTAAAESPPPTTVKPLDEAMARAIASVPAAKEGSSNNPYDPAPPPGNYVPMAGYTPAPTTDTNACVGQPFDFDADGLNHFDNIHNHSLPVRQ